MKSVAPDYLGLIEKNFNDKDVDSLIEHFRDPDRRKAFFKEYKEIEMLYEIISPDAFLRPFIASYGTLSGIYAVVRKAYTKPVYADRAFQKKTNELVQQHIGADFVAEPRAEYLVIDENTIETIKAMDDGDATKVINLIKSISKTAEEQSEDPYLIALAERAQLVQESFEKRQSSTQEALEELFRELEGNEKRKQEQAEKGFDGLTYFIYSTLLNEGVDGAEAVSGKIRTAFLNFPNWRKSEASLRELRQKVTFAIAAEMDDLDRVVKIVDDLFTVLEKANRV
jgi:type I restriction enzyme R subunit